MTIEEALEYAAEHLPKGVVIHVCVERCAGAVMKRGIYGVYHHASRKHLARYVDEFAFRLSDGRVKRTTLNRVDSMVAGAVGKRITYKALVS